MHRNDGQSILVLTKENCLVHITALELQIVDKYRDEFLVPMPCALLESIKGLSKSADHSCRVWCCISRRLLHIYDFSRGELPVEVNSFDVDWVHFHVE
jgi:hypothetical protein